VPSHRAIAFRSRIHARLLVEEVKCSDGAVDRNFLQAGGRKPTGGGTVPSCNSRQRIRLAAGGNIVMWLVVEVNPRPRVSGLPIQTRFSVRIPHACCGLKRFAVPAHGAYAVGTGRAAAGSRRRRTSAASNKPAAPARCGDDAKFRFLGQFLEGSGVVVVDELQIP